MKGRKHGKRCPTSLVVKMTKQYLYTLVRATKIKKSATMKIMLVRVQTNEITVCTK